MSERNAFLKETEVLRDLRALEVIERDPGVSQRELAHTLGVAVGVANACVRALVRKGLVKIRGSSNRSITYHLTKAGVLHKSVLAMDWTRNTIDFYVQARRHVATRLVALADAGVRRVALDGANELSEIAALVSAHAGLEIVGVFSDGASPLGDAILGVPVSPIEAPEVTAAPDAVVFCVDPTSERIAQVRERFPNARLAGLVGQLPQPGPEAVTAR